MLSNHILASLKAYTALLGAIATALLGAYGPETEVGHVLTIVLAVVTAIATWAVPNAAAPIDDEA